jgi:molybdate transport system ATP-binding protein
MAGTARAPLARALMLAVNVAKRRGAFALEVAFKAPTPGIVALFGRSGCGKTTVVEILAGLLAPDAGAVRLDDVVLVDTAAGRSLPAERRRIGYVFQDARLFPHLDVRGNLRYGQKRAPAPPHAIAFDEVTDLLGLAPLLARRPYTLSGGERQRVALGRALLSQPRLLLLDEPLASLDAQRRAEVLPYLEALRDRLSIPMVYVSHQFDEVMRLATHVVLMESGRVLAAGGIHEVSLTPELNAIVGADAVGAVLEGVITAVDVPGGLARLQLGRGTLLVSAADARVGARARVQLLARDLILATHPAHGLSVRNSIAGVVQEIRNDVHETQLVTVDIGGASVLARVTRDAVAALALSAGSPVWVLVKAVSMRSHTL